MLAAPNGGYVYAERVDAEDRGLTLLDFLCRRHPRASREEWGARLAAGEVQVAGQPASTDQRLAAGARVSWRRPPWVEPEVPLDFSVLYQDDVLLIADKPSGLPTVPAGGFLEHTLLALVCRADPGWAPMHRLGRATSGLVCFARPAARAALQATFRARALEKRYLALASGRVAAPQGLHFPIGEVPHPRLGSVHAATPSGRVSESHVEASEPRGAHSRVLLRLVTGRPHQLRIHLAAAGHPLVGDPLYGPGGRPLADQPGLPGDGGYLLHAWRLAFAHPVDGRPLAFEAPIPAALR